MGQQSTEKRARYQRKKTESQAANGSTNRQDEDREQRLGYDYTILPPGDSAVRSGPDDKRPEGATESLTASAPRTSVSTEDRCVPRIWFQRLSSSGSEDVLAHHGDGRGEDSPASLTGFVAHKSRYKVAWGRAPQVLAPLDHRHKTGLLFEAMRGNKRRR